MRVTRVVAVLSVCGLLGASQATKVDADDVKGGWSVVSITIGDKSAPADLIKGVVTSYDGRNYINQSGDTVLSQGAYEVDPSKTPRAIDLVAKQGPGVGKRQLGVYKIEGDLLSVCLSEPGSEKRPSSFETKNDAALMLIVMKRVRR